MAQRVIAANGLGDARLGIMMKHIMKIVENGCDHNSKPRGVIPGRKNRVKQVLTNGSDYRPQLKSRLSPSLMNTAFITIA